MSDKYVLGVRSRKEMGKGPNRRLHQSGDVPGVFYNNKGDNIPFIVSGKDLQKVCDNMGLTQVFSLEIDENGKKTAYDTLLWKVERHPFIKRFQHVDLLGVDPDKEVQVRVPLEFEGTPKGVKLGGRLEAYRRHFMIAAKPFDLPARLTIDVSGMDVADVLHADDVALPANTRRIDAGNFAVVTVLRTRGTVEDGTAEAAAEA